MSSKSLDKLPKYVFRTAFGVFRFKRNVPKDIREVSGKVFFYKWLWKLLSKQVKRMPDKKPSMSDLLKQKQERQQETYYQKHQGAQKGNPARGKEVNIGKNGSNR